MWTPILIFSAAPVSYLLCRFVVTHWPGRKRKEQEAAARRRHQALGEHQRGSRLMHAEELTKMINRHSRDKAD